MLKHKNLLRYNYVLLHRLEAIKTKRLCQEQSYRSFSTTLHVVETVNIGFLNKIIALYEAFGVQYHALKKE